LQKLRACDGNRANRPGRKIDPRGADVQVPQVRRDGSKDSGNKIIFRVSLFPVERLSAADRLPRIQSAKSFTHAEKGRTSEVREKGGKEGFEESPEEGSKKD
jgi:hypothetical protein